MRHKDLETESSMMEWLFSALHSQFGVCIQTENVVRLERKLRAMRDSEPLLAEIEFRQSPTAPNEIWLIKGDS